MCMCTWDWCSWSEATLVSDLCLGHIYTFNVPEVGTAPDVPDNMESRIPGFMGRRISFDLAKCIL